jgi:oligoendopeptidase F
MFAEFEKLTHERAEEGRAADGGGVQDDLPRTAGTYFGPDFQIDDQLALECFPHPALLSRVLRLQVRHGDVGRHRTQPPRAGRRCPAELQQYLGFLQGGCSKFPLELLREAGVDMVRPEPVDAALQRFGELVDELDALL